MCLKVQHGSSKMDHLLEICLPCIATSIKPTSFKFYTILNILYNTDNAMISATYVPTSNDEKPV